MEKATKFGKVVEKLADEIMRLLGETGVGLAGFVVAEAQGLGDLEFQGFNQRSNSLAGDHFQLIIWDRLFVEIAGEEQLQQRLASGDDLALGGKVRTVNAVDPAHLLVRGDE